MTAAVFSSGSHTKSLLLFVKFQCILAYYLKTNETHRYCIFERQKPSTFQFGVFCVMMDQHKRPWVSNAWASFKLLTKRSNAIRGFILNKINFYFKIKEFI